MKLETAIEHSFLVKEIGTQMAISEKMLRMDVRPEVGAVIITTIITALSRPLWSIQYPADWWQAFKARWFPRWLLALYPVGYTVHIAERYCPHIAVENPETHMDWLELPYLQAEHDYEGTQYPLPTYRPLPCP